MIGIPADASPTVPHILSMSIANRLQHRLDCHRTACGKQLAFNFDISLRKSGTKILAS
jgi:hypothetical protein